MSMDEFAEFRQHLKYYRRQCTDVERGGMLTQARLAEFIGREIDFPITSSTISNWEQGNSMPRRSDWLIIQGLIKALHLCGGIETVEQANTFLASGYYRSLTDEEISLIDVAWDDAEVTRIVPQKQMGTNDSVPVEAQGLPRGSRIPFAMNPLFIGREGSLQRLVDLFQIDAVDTVLGKTVAITGLGGVGKTQLSVAFAHQYGRYFPGGIFWLNFGDKTVLDVQVASCGGVNGLALRHDFDDLILEKQVQHVMQAWHEPTRRLLIFDECEDEQQLVQWRPAYGGCAILVTSRRGQWDLALGVDTLSLNGFTPAESGAFLRQFQPEIHLEHANAIAAELGYLPLALHLAGSFLRHFHAVVSPADYLSQLQSLQGATLFEHPSLQGRGARYAPTGHALHLARTFALSFEQLDWENDVDQLAGKLLARAAHLSPSNVIPKELLLGTVYVTDEQLVAYLETADDDFQPFASVPTESSSTQPYVGMDALLRLINLGLIMEGSPGFLMPLHQLTVDFVQPVVEPSLAQAAIEISLLAKLALYPELVGFLPLPDWEPHMQHLVVQAQSRSDLNGAYLTQVVGHYMRNTAKYEYAESCLQWALDLFIAKLGINHWETANAQMTLAMYLLDIRKLERAETAVQQALVVYENIGGCNHPKKARALSSLAFVFVERGDWEQAAAYAELAANVWQQQQEETLMMAYCYTFLGVVQQRLGYFTQSRYFEESALQIREDKLGANYIDTVVNWNNLGGIYLETGEYDKARRFFELALSHFDIHEGEISHSDVGTYRNNLGRALFLLGKYDEAKRCLQQAHAEIVVALDPTHALAAFPLHNLGDVLVQLNNQVAARAYYEKALHIRQQALGDDHPFTAKTLNQLGKLLYKMGETTKGYAMLAQALAIREQKLIPLHPELAVSYNDLGEYFLTKGDLAEAQSYLEQALSIRQQKLGNGHVLTAVTQRNLRATQKL